MDLLRHLYHNSPHAPRSWDAFLLCQRPHLCQQLSSLCLPSGLEVIPSSFIHSFCGTKQEPKRPCYFLSCFRLNRPCAEVDVPQEYQTPGATNTTTVAIFICHSLCQLYRDSCSASLISEGLDPDMVIICEKPFNPRAHGVPTENIMPNGPNYTVPISADGGNTFFNWTFSCYEGNKTSVLEYNCPEGFHQVEDQFCTYDCPQPLVTDEQYDSLTAMVTVMGWISFVCLLVLISCYLTTPAKWSYPAILPLFFFSALLGRCFAFCLGSMVGHYDIWCDGDGEPNQWGDPWCTIQGIFFVYFTLAGAAWWAVISLQLFFAVVINSDLFGRIIKPHLMATLHACCWGLPLLPLVIALSTEHLGFGHELWCTIHSSEDLTFEPTPEGPKHQPDEEAEANIWNLMLFTIPILLLVCVCTVLLACVAVAGYRISHQGWKFFVTQWRLIAFLLLYIVIYSFVLSFQIDFHVAKEEQYAEYSSFLKCTFNNAAADAVGRPTGIVCELESKISYGLWMVATFCEVAQGFFVFLIFGTTAEVYKGWWKLLRHQRLPSRSSSSSDHATELAGTNLKKVKGHTVLTTQKQEEEEDEH
ncbi:hypothetical protein QOT17_002080 [Balamuthia mandrillaris]